jgi:hypothetical protein
VNLVSSEKRRAVNDKDVKFKLENVSNAMAEFQTSQF